MTATWFRTDPQRAALILTIHAQPGAQRSEVVGLHGDALKVRIAAPPVEGKANLVLIAFVAELFDVPIKQVRLLRGDASRHKMVEIIGSKKDPATLINTP